MASLGVHFMLAGERCMRMQQTSRLCTCQLSMQVRMAPAMFLGATATPVDVQKFQVWQGADCIQHRACQMLHAAELVRDDEVVSRAAAPKHRVISAAK